MILTPEQMRAAEQAAFARGLSEETLMEQAGDGIARAVQAVFPQPGDCLCVFGKGHNGGDVLVAARHLAKAGWRIGLEAVGEDLAPLTARQLDHLTPFVGQPGAAAPQVILDGILGTGTRGTPRGSAACAIRAIRARREHHGATVFSADIPSGLDAATGEPAEPCVLADHTVTIGFAKTGLLADAATPCVGRLWLAPLDGVEATDGDPWQLAEPSSLRLPPMPFDRHKGQAGRVSVVAGSPGLTGAARLCSAAAVRGGAGLVTLFADPAVAPALEASCAPEVMVRRCASLREVLDTPADALAIGPGLGRARDQHVLALVRDFAGPAVVDADALNALSTDPGLLRMAQGARVLTPHPGEMERLDPQAGRTRRQWAHDFATSHATVLLLKGARTVIAAPRGPGWFNTTGNPGMATGGLGDILTGVCAALLAGGPTDHAKAAATAAWLCGRAAELAIARSAPDALAASDLLATLGIAFADLRAQR